MCRDLKKKRCPKEIQPMLWYTANTANKAITVLSSLILTLLSLFSFFFLALQLWKTGSCSLAWCQRSATRTTSGSCSLHSDRSRSAESSEGRTDWAEVCVTPTHFHPHVMLLMWILLPQRPPADVAVQCVCFCRDSNSKPCKKSWPQLAGGDGFWANGWSVSYIFLNDNVHKNRGI